MTVTTDEYNREKMDFIRKHNENAECKVFTSPMENNRYHKEYCWSNGAAWMEVTELVTEEKEVEAHGLTFKVEVEMWKTEFWSTERGSKYVYEK